MAAADTLINIIFQLYMVPANGLYYKVIKDEYTLDCVKPQPTASKFSFLYTIYVQTVA